MRNIVLTLLATSLLSNVFGCASTLLRPSVTVTPLLVDAADVQLLTALVREQDRRIETCDTQKSCPQDRYVRGLLALFQGRAQAVAAFQQVKSEAPNTRLAVLSTSWIDLLHTDLSSDVSKIIDDLVWEILERELSDLPNEPVRTLWSDRAQRVGTLSGRRPAISSDQGSIPEVKDQATIHALEKRLRERERTLTERDHQLAVLTSQLEVLKQIDHETQNKRRSLHYSK